MRLICPRCSNPFEQDAGAWLRACCPSCGAMIVDGPGGLALVDPESARQKVRPPAIGLMIVGVLIAVTGQILPVFMGVGLLSDPNPVRGEDQAALVMGLAMVAVSGLLGLLVGGAVCVGGYQMYRLRSYALAITASLIAIVSVFALCVTLCCPLASFGLGGLPALPVGIWALVVLNDPNVQRSFL